jgi:hypothetical protein
MRSKSVTSPFIVSLVIAPIASLLAWSLGGPHSGSLVVKVLFVVTVMVEIFALLQIVAARRMFSPSDPGHLTWTFIVAFLVIRLVAELRLISITFDIVQVPASMDSATPLRFFYVVWLRYLYTVSDVLFVGALIATIRAYKSTGLKFGLIGRDFLYILLVCAMPVTTYIFRANLGLAGLITSDSHIATYRLVAVFVGALIASLCLVIRRFAVQMGGGAVSRVWSSVAAAGIARDASFLALALLSVWWRPGAEFLEQYLLWIFATLWLLTGIYQQEVLPLSSAVAAMQPAELKA